MKKLDASGYATDKAKLTHYLRNYEKYFSGYVDKDICLLELGIYKGGSLLFWRDFFKNGKIIGLDVNSVNIKDNTGRIRTYQGMQEDTVLLDHIAKDNAPTGFDIVIDDCSHVGESTKISFWHIFENYLKPGGIYAIEDWGTGYWDNSPDGKHYNIEVIPKNNSLSLHNKINILLYKVVRFFVKKNISGISFIPKFLNYKFPNHSYGMAGFVKQLVDECAMGDITHPENGTGNYRASKFEYMHISHGLVIIIKSRESSNIR